MGAVTNAIPASEALGGALGQRSARGVRRNGSVRRRLGQGSIASAVGRVIHREIDSGIYRSSAISSEIEQAISIVISVARSIVTDSQIDRCIDRQFDSGLCRELDIELD